MTLRRPSWSQRVRPPRSSSYRTAKSEAPRPAEMSHERVRAIRDRAGMGPAEFADFLGVSDKTIWLWESAWGQRPRAPMPLLLALIEERGIEHVSLPADR